jgi:hypothetical protein
MKRFGFVLISLLAAAPAGCAGMQSQSGGSATPAAGTRALPPAVQRQLSLTMVHYVQLPVHPDRRPSHMSPDAGKKSALLYVGDDATNDVDVYDYKTLKLVGMLTGAVEPYGMCVDKKGDIYVANFGAGNVVEYAHGGKNPINTYTSGGEPIGCSVDAKGDVAVTSFSPGQVVVFAGGNPKKPTSYSGPCTYLWTMGYDDNGNLVGIGEESTGSIVACALLSGSKSMTTLSGCCTGSNITIDFPGGTMWDGKYIALGDQESGGRFEGGIIQATLSGGAFIKEGETVITDTCYSDYVDDVNPFIVGKKNTPVNRVQGKVDVGPNLWCNDAGTSAVDFWKYPAGGNPFKRLNSPPSEPYGAAVSLKT